MMKRTIMKVSLAVVLVLGVASAAETAAPAAAQTCDGDCNGDGSVTIDEIIIGVRQALGDARIRECPATDGDGNGAVTVNELVAAITRALDGCDGAVPPTSTPTSPDTPVPTGTPGPMTIGEEAVAASARVATDSILRFFDLQASVDTALSAAARPGADAGRPTDVSGCQQFDCPLFGTHEDCCSSTQFNQFFSNCALNDKSGGVGILNGLFVLLSDSADVCTGGIPPGSSFAVSLNNFTQDVTFPDGSFSRTFQELSETFEIARGGCTLGQPDPFGFGVRGDGRRFFDGELQQFQGDGSGNILVDTASEVHGFEVAVGSTQEADGCAVEAALNGSLTSADFRVGTQFTADFTDFGVGQRLQAGALSLKLDGTVDTDCLGDVRVLTPEPLRLASGDTCFTAGRLEVQLGDGTASVIYTDSAAVDFDFGADGSVDQHFANCADVPTDQCHTSLIGLCGACTGLNQCQRGLECFPCSDDCSGNTRRCGLFDTFVPCADGVF